MKEIGWLSIFALVFCLSGTALAETCGHYEDESFIFDGLPGTHDYDFGPTAVGSSSDWFFDHKFDVSPDDVPNTTWELTYCIHLLRESDGAEAVYGDTRYFQTNGSSVFSGDQIDDAPQYVTDGNFPAESDLNFYTVNNANGSNDDYMHLSFWFDAWYPDTTVTVQANWRVL